MNFRKRKIRIQEINSEQASSIFTALHLRCTVRQHSIYDSAIITEPYFRSIDDFLHNRNFKTILNYGSSMHHGI